METRVDQQLIRRIISRPMPMPSEDALNSFVASFGQWAYTFGITEPKRIAAYLSNVLVESNYLRSDSENLNYSAEGLMKTWPSRFDRAKAEAYARNPEKIANYVYANRYGNGNEASGDGWRYRGRGLIQLTFKANYESFSKYDLCTKDVVKNPDSVAQFPLNQIAAMWYWEQHNLNEKADNSDTEAIRRAINGGLNGYADVMVLYRRLEKELGIKKF